MISICMIVKDEEKNIGECLKRLCKLGYQMIVVDTGSNDNTRKIAMSYTDKVFDFKWNNDFSAARNFSIERAFSDYVLVIDSDEYVTEFHKEEIEELLKKNSMGVGRIRCINKFTRNGQLYSGKERISRLFNREIYHYEGKIHEQLISVENKQYYYNVPMTVEHTGYEGDFETRKKKTQRNITLLKIQLEKKEDPYILYQLGKSYYMQEEYTTANEYFSKALYFDLDPQLEYVHDMIESYGYSLLDAKEYNTAKSLLNVYKEFSHSADFLFLVALIYMNNGHFKEAISEFEKAALKEECKMEGANSYLAWYNIGVIHECLGEKEKANKYYKMCGDYEKANKRLQSF